VKSNEIKGKSNKTPSQEAMSVTESLSKMSLSLKEP